MQNMFLFSLSFSRKIKAFVELYNKRRKIRRLTLFLLTWPSAYYICNFTTTRVEFYAMIIIKILLTEKEREGRKQRLSNVTSSLCLFCRFLQQISDIRSEEKACGETVLAQKQELLSHHTTFFKFTLTVCLFAFKNNENILPYKMH